MASADSVDRAEREMQSSSDLFRTLRYTAELAKAAPLLTRIAESELRALSFMEEAWSEIRTLPARPAASIALAAE